MENKYYVITKVDYCNDIVSGPFGFKRAFLIWKDMKDFYEGESVIAKLVLDNEGKEVK